MKPLISVVIATKNREKYCIETIKNLTSYDPEILEIVVSDNSDTKYIEDFLSNKNYSNLRYSYTSDDISSIDNFNLAMSMAIGTFVILIGDDDTIHPKIIELAKWALENNVDSLCSREVYSFYWPEADPDIPEGYLKIPFLIKGRFEKVDAKEELIKLLRNGLVNYMFYKVPKSYHGLVRLDIMQEIKKITGNFYGGLSPDIFSVVAISLLTKKHYVYSEPLSIAGVCPSSTSSDQIKGIHAGKLEDMPHLRNRKNYVWNENIPKFYSVTTTWGDSGLKALHDMNESNILRHFNPYPLYSQALLMNRNTILKLAINEIEKLRKEKDINITYFWLRILFSSQKLIIEKVSRTIKLKYFKPYKTIRSVKDFNQVFKSI